MDLFGMGMGEILLVLLVALIIWGPGKIPEIARTLGRMAYTLRKASFDLTSTVTKELSMEEKDHQAQPKTESSEKTREIQDAGTSESNDTETTSPRD